MEDQINLKKSVRVWRVLVLAIFSSILLAGCYTNSLFLSLFKSEEKETGRIVDLPEEKIEKWKKIIDEAQKKVTRAEREMADLEKKLEEAKEKEKIASQLNKAREKLKEAREKWKKTKMKHREAINKAHLALKEKGYPSASDCAGCHPDHYEDWSLSQHAYAQLSPVFLTMHGATVKLTNGTNGDFCIRCHNPLGISQGEKIFADSKNLPSTSFEGVTCVVCHRIGKPYGKVSGRMKFLKGGLEKPVFGPQGNANLKKFQKENPENKRPLHNKVKEFSVISTSSFCGSCHDVNLVNGFRLEEAFSEYKNSPAALKGRSCQDCHMGQTEGKFVQDQPLFTLGLNFQETLEKKSLKKLKEAFQKFDFDLFPSSGISVVEEDKKWILFDKTKGPGHPYLIEKKKGKLEVYHYNYGWRRATSLNTPYRKFTSHIFAGPDYSIVHPGIFPHNLQAKKLATISEWLTFDYKSDWGKSEFENQLKAFSPEERKLIEEKLFPKAWRDSKKRIAARNILQVQFSRLHRAERKRREVLQNGFVLGDIIVDKAGEEGIEFQVQIKNGTDGHNVPTGFIAERIIYLEVTVTDREGKVVFQSGDLDPNGDLRNAHSIYVHNGELPLDPYLFNLQSKFIVRLARGGEREQILPINYSASPLPFLRPQGFSNILIGRPRGARIHKKGIVPGDDRWPAYSVDPSKLTGKGPYKAKIRFIAGMVPPNLIDTIKVAGFSFDMTPRQVSNLVVQGYLPMWERELVLKPGRYKGSDQFKVKDRPEDRPPLQFSRDFWKAEKK